MTNKPIEPATYFFPSDGNSIPNNPTLPVLIYNQVFNTVDESIANQFEDAFRKNGWTGCWRWSVYDFHHFHCDAHEALGVASGTANLHLGGPHGKAFEVSAGDLIVLPAGTGHKNLGCSHDFQVVGSYPVGQENYTTNRSDAAEYDNVLKRITATPLPESDPMYGKDGPLMRLWRKSLR